MVDRGLRRFYATCAERLMRQPYALTADVGGAQDVVARRMAINRLRETRTQRSVRAVPRRACPRPGPGE